MLSRAPVETPPSKHDDRRRACAKSRVNPEDIEESRVKGHDAAHMTARQDANDAKPSAGDEHRVVVVAQALGGGGSGAGTRGVSNSPAVRTIRAGEIDVPTLVASATMIVGEHEVSALQQSWLTGVWHCSFCSP